MGSFGSEFIRVAATESYLAPYSPPELASILRSIAQDSIPRYLYFDREFELLPDLLPTTSVGGRVEHVLEFPPQHTLWFSARGLLVIRDRVVVIVRGRIRADRSEIFRLPEVGDLSVSRSTARVIIASTRLDTIYPEWFGVQPFESNSLVGRGPSNENGPRIRRNARGLQACVRAACRDRVVPEDGRRLPPLTVSLRGINVFDETVVVEPAPSGTGALVLKGESDAMRRGAGVATLIRIPRGVPGVVLNDPEAADAAALWVDPRVSLAMEGVGLKVELRGPIPDDGLDVATALSLPESALTPPWRHAHLDRCGLSGGVGAVIAVRDARASGSRVSSGELRSDRSRATRYSLRDVTLDGAAGPSASSRFVIDLGLTQDAMVDIRGGVMFETEYVPVRPPDLAAGIRLGGGSLLVRSVSMHLPIGPRPSRGRAGTANAEPDGQDLFVDSGPRHEVAAHATMLHVDSQSWWFLGANALGDREAPSVVSVLNVGAGNINWHPGSPGALQSAQEQRSALVDPPSIAWAGGRMRAGRACSMGARRGSAPPPRACSKAARPATTSAIPWRARGM